MTACAKPVQADDEVSVEQQAFFDAEGDPERAIDLLTSRILADPKIVSSYLPEWAKTWARQRISNIVANGRAKIIRVVSSAQPAETGGFSKALGQAMSNEFRRLMDMPIHGGKRIADATPDEVRESAAWYQQTANGYARMACWQHAVAVEAAKNGGDTIGASLSEATLTRLWSEANV